LQTKLFGSWWWLWGPLHALTFRLWVVLKYPWLAVESRKLRSSWQDYLLPLWVSSLMKGLCHSSGGGYSGSIPGQVVCFSMHFSFPRQFSFHQLLPHSSIIFCAVRVVSKKRRRLILPMLCHVVLCYDMSSNCVCVCVCVCRKGPVSEWVLTRVTPQ
jgi:hypothetical protein